MQRMFHGHITATALADQLAARFNDRHNRTAISSGSGTSLVQIGSKHGTPVSVHIADTEGGVLVTMSQDRGAALPVDLPRVRPKCGRAHTSDALFCQACGTRLVTG